MQVLIFLKIKYKEQKRKTKCKYVSSSTFRPSTNFLNKQGLDTENIKKTKVVHVISVEQQAAISPSFFKPRTLSDLHINAKR